MGDAAKEFHDLQLCIENLSASVEIEKSYDVNTVFWLLKKKTFSDQYEHQSFLYL